MTTFLLNKMCLENEKKSGKRRFTTFFQKTTVLLLPNWGSPPKKNPLHPLYSNCTQFGDQGFL